MLWHYCGQMAVHGSDSWDIEQVCGIFELPERNVVLIRTFLYSNRDLIVRYKYNPASGEAPWGNAQSQAELHQALAARMSDDEWTVGVIDKQVKAYLVAFYHHMLNNVDLYCPDSPAKELATNEPPTSR